MAKDMYQKREERKKKALENNENNGVNKSVINWYPGHMAKAIKQIEIDLNLIDIVIEILDARIPISSQNPEIKKIIKNKKRIVILNKSDLANEDENKKWIKYFQEKDIPTISCNSNSGEGIKNTINIINMLMKEEKEKALNKGRVGKIIRVMIIGIPNVGKSSFINRISQKASAQVGNRPGVTKQKQWIRISDNIELLDTPGVLWPKFQDEQTALNLAYTGTIKNEILEESEIAYQLLKFMLKDYKDNIVEKYKLDKEDINKRLNNNEQQENEKIINIMEQIGENRGFIVKGKVIDLDKVSKLLLDDFKNGKIGKITIEKSQYYKEEKCLK